MLFRVLAMQSDRWVGFVLYRNIVSRVGSNKIFTNMLTRPRAVICLVDTAIDLVN